jgi:hypothetical protein
MSLDKFVSRGYSGSVGDTTGQWVGRSVETPPAQPAGAPRESGTSFVMGGSRTSTAGYRAKSNQNFDTSRSRDVDDIMHRGTKYQRDERNTGDLRQNCFGGSSRGFDSSGPDASTPYPIKRAFRLVMVAFGIVGVLYLVFSWPQSSRERVRSLREQQVMYGYSE